MESHEFCSIVMTLITFTQVNPSTTHKQISKISKLTDWSAGAQTGANYLTARNRVSSVGEFLGAFLDWLHENNQINLEEVSLIGFSLGGERNGSLYIIFDFCLSINQLMLLVILGKMCEGEESVRFLDLILQVLYSVLIILLNDWLLEMLYTSKV